MDACTALTNATQVHFVGVKGVAQCALALLLKEKGVIVTGSDVMDRFPTDVLLEKAGIPISSGFSHIPEHTGAVVYTGAHRGKTNEEVLDAIHKGVPVFAHAQALGCLMNGRRQISVAGCHGKTTTTAMTALLLKAADMDPSYAIGAGQIRGLGDPGHWGKGKFFIAEADEYVTDPHHDETPRFLWQSPEILVISNIEYDHPDVYPDIRATIHAFQLLIGKVVHQGIVILNGDDVYSKELAIPSHLELVTVGFDETSTYRIRRGQKTNGSNTFSLQTSDRSYGPFSLSVPGEHMVRDAAQAVVVALRVCVPEQTIAKGLAIFNGAARRMEVLKETKKWTVMDDYAHHPSEIRASLRGIQEQYPGRNLIVVVFQPHTYSRTQALLSDFARAFEDASRVFVTEIYASAREQMGEIDGRALTEQVSRHHSAVSFASSPDELYDRLFVNSPQGGVVIFMGAGNIRDWGEGFAKKI